METQQVQNLIHSIDVQNKSIHRLEVVNADLLEACKQARAVIKDLEPNITVDKLEQAINKAEGK